MRLVIDGGNANRHNKLDQFLRVILTKDKWVLDSRPDKIVSSKVGQHSQANFVQENDVSQIIAPMNGILFWPWAPTSYIHFF